MKVEYVVPGIRLSGKRELTLAMIRALNAHLSIPAESLIQVAQEPLPKDLADLDFAQFPIKEMERNGAFSGFNLGMAKIDEKAEEAMRWLIGQIGGFQAVPQVALRKTDGMRLNAKLDNYALLGWSLQALKDAADNPLPVRFTSESLTDKFVETLAGLSVLDDGPKHAKEYLAKAGITLLALTLRYDRVDNFWFVLLHELGHLKLGHLAAGRTWIADDLDLPDADSTQEKEADDFATRVLVPVDFDLSSRIKLSSNEVIRYASDHGVHPAIVAGRIQHEKKDFRTFANLLGRGEVRMHFPPAGRGVQGDARPSGTILTIWKPWSSILSGNHGPQCRTGRSQMNGLALVTAVALAAAIANQALTAQVVGDQAVLVQVTRPMDAPTMDAPAILAAVEQVLAPDDYRMLVEMKTIAARGEERLMSLEIFYKRGTGSLMELLAPARLIGIRFLERDQGLWMYNPRSGGGRAIRLSPREAFQGTVFSNADLSDARFTTDYEPVLTGIVDYDHPDLGRIQAYRLSASARSPASSYGRIDFWVAIQDLVPLKMDYYAKSGLLFKTLRLEQVRLLAGRARPSLMVMESRTEPGSQTIVIIKEMDLRDNPPGLFSQENLVR
jgi:HTH-type transcriptional regulator/antitoxin HigA